MFSFPIDLKGKDKQIEEKSCANSVLHLQALVCAVFFYIKLIKLSYLN